MGRRRETVIKALEKLGISSPSEIWRITVQIDPSITLSDVNFELYHGNTDSRNPIYRKVGRGKYALLEKSEREIE